MSNEILSTINVDEITHSDILVVGVGGAGGNALNNMIKSSIYNVTFMACNTDKDALEKSNAELRLQLGPDGDGAGSNPAKGRALATESLSDIFEMLRASGSKMIFFTAGMGGGTGTGATPVIARAARELHEQMMQENEASLGILTVAVVTTPFTNEGPVRIRQAQEGIEELRKYVDAILIINNDNLIGLCGDLPQEEAMMVLDGILTSAVKGMAEIITLYGRINIDIADANTVLRNSGNVLMCTGRASGIDRAKEAVESCFSSPLLENRDIKGARHILLDIHSSSKRPYTMNESNLIRNMLQERTGGQTTIIWGDCTKEELGEDIEIVIVASGFDAATPAESEPAIENEEPTTEPLTTEEPTTEEPTDEEESSLSVAKFRGVDRYDNIDHIYKTPAIKRYGGSFEELRSSAAPKKSVRVEAPADEKPQESFGGEGTLFSSLDE